MTNTPGNTPKASQRRSHHSWPARVLLHQLRSAIQSLGHLYRSPLSSLMIIVVIGMTLALPLGLYMALNSLQQLNPGWQQQAPISVYLQQDSTDRKAQQLRTELLQHHAIADVQYITPEEGLLELRQQAGYGGILDALDDNPLPGVLVVSTKTPQHADAITALTQTLAQNTLVDQVKIDIDWVKRLQALLTLGQQVVLLLAVSLGMGVLLIVGNVIALSLQQYKQDMLVYQWLGASDGFIRQPFLYMGAWIGALGGITAWGLVHAAAYVLQPAMEQLSTQYGLSLSQHALAYQQGIQCATMGAVLGMVGARLAVNRYLRSATTH